jgi:hypothetical protein
VALLRENEDVDDREAVHELGPPIGATGRCRAVLVVAVSGDVVDVDPDDRDAPKASCLTRA